MKEFQYTVKDACGIHARPAGLLVKVAKGFASTATLEKDGKSCDLRKLMALMGRGVKQGDTVTVKVEGDDEAAAAEAIQKFLTDFFCHRIQNSGCRITDWAFCDHLQIYKNRIDFIFESPAVLLRT